MKVWGISICITVLLMLLTQSTNYAYTHSITPSASTPFEQLAQGQQPQPQQPLTTGSKPGTILLTTFPNGTSKATFVNSTTVQVLNGVGYLVLDPGAYFATASASAPVSNTIVNRIYQAIAIAIGITINDPVPGPPLFPFPPQPNETEPEGQLAGLALRSAFI